MVLALALAATVSLGGCETRSGTVTPSFVGDQGGWLPTKIPASTSATEVANQLIPVLKANPDFNMPENIGPKAPIELERTFPIWAPKPGATHLTWDTLEPTGQFVFIAKDVQTGERGMFGIRPDP